MPDTALAARAAASVSSGDAASSGDTADTGEPDTKTEVTSAEADSTDTSKDKSAADPPKEPDDAPTASRTVSPGPATTEPIDKVGAQIADEGHAGYSQETAAQHPATESPYESPATVDVPERPESTPEAGGPVVRILSGTKRYHRPDCALIEDIGDDADDLESLTRSEAKARGCTPCLVCQPDKEPATRD
jgi:hypothetical protein